MKKFRIKYLLIFVGAVIILFLCTSAFLSICYKIPFDYVINEITRKIFFSITYISTQFYDPSAITEANTGPNIEEQESKNAYMRIEEFLSLERNKELYKITAIENRKRKKSTYSFNYQPFEESDLHTLRTKYKLDKIIEVAEDEFQSFVLLRGWARTRFSRSDYQPMMANFNALTVLDRNLKNVNNAAYSSGHYRPCHFAPLFYSQILLSVGYIPRLTTISPGKFFIGHGNVEVWSNQYKKWILMDADLNLHYEKNGVPLNLLEIHNERYAPGKSDMKIVYGDFVKISDDSVIVEKISEDTVRTVDNMINYHSYFGIVDLRNDWMTNHYFKGHPKKSDFSQLFWKDAQMPKMFNLNFQTSNVSEFYWPLNITEILVKHPDDGNDDNLNLFFNTFTPNFDHFNIVVNDTMVTTSHDGNYKFDTYSGKNKVFVYAVNKFGIKGVPSYFEIYKY